MRNLALPPSLRRSTIDSNLPVVVQLILGYVGSWTWKYLRLCKLYNARGGEIPKMCGWLMKTIQMTVRRLAFLRRLLPKSWMFSCVTALLVRGNFPCCFGDYDFKW
ncbi:uncharacterized protein LOC122570273 isoform X2 [Bombus pyrosoma]|uniref:uncharacterized protein LOC122570273 isoform X2 n=1 Tax=Bombus pyrosoma TaxID=396416 RepID=UPI001CB9CCB5|nr:uncharacterized protein LOC122570273 isoform X2 [Bombus pyrosoma]